MLLQAEMRAAVFLAMDEQDRLEVTDILLMTCRGSCNFTDCAVFFPSQSKTPLINENLKKCLNTKDGQCPSSSSS